MPTLRKILMQPIPMPQALSSTQQRLRHWRLIDVLMLWPTGILAGIISGALMNAIGGLLNPSAFRFYFSAPFLFLPPSWNEWEEIVQYGMWEGFCIGIIFGFIFTIYVAIVSRASCPYVVGSRALLRTVSLLWIVWFLCGLNTILLHRFAPSTLETFSQSMRWIYSGHYFRTPDDFASGSIRGLYFFGIFAVIAGCIWFSAGWRKYKEQRGLN